MPDNGSEEPMDGGRLAKYKRKKRIIAAAAVCFLAALGFTGYRYMNEYEYTGYSVQWERSMRYTENSGADKKTQVAETSAAADSAGTDGAGETASAESSGASGAGSGTPDETRPRKLLHWQKRQKRSAIASFVKFAMFGDNVTPSIQRTALPISMLRQNDLDPEL